MRHDRHVSIWSREFVLLFGSCVLFWAAFLLYLPTIPVYMVRYLHSSPALVGLVTGLTALAAVVIRPFAGYAVDRWGRRWVYCACLLAFSGACFSYILATDLRTLVVVRLLFGLPFGVATVAGMTIAGDVAPPGRRGEAVGLFALAQTISMALAPVAALDLGRCSVPRSLCDSRLPGPGRVPTGLAGALSSHP